MFEKIDEKIEKNYNLGTQGANRCFDEKLKTSRKNKEGDHLYIYRRSDFGHPRGPIGCYNNSAIYWIFNSNGEKLGYINCSLCNNSLGKEVDIKYENIKSETLGKGNISLALFEVLKKIFISKDLDNKPVADGFYSNVTQANLSITPENRLAAIAIAKKNGFELVDETTMILKKDRFLEKMRSEELER